MADKALILTLAKVVIAAAWADEQISPAESANLKDLIFDFSSSESQPISGAEWQRLEMYVDSPITPAERERLVQELQARLQSASDKALVISTLEALMQADGQVSSAEQAVVAEIRQAVDEVAVSGWPRLHRLVVSAIRHRLSAGHDGKPGVPGSSEDREQLFTDYVNNKIFYRLRQRSDLVEKAGHLSEAELRKLCLAGGLMVQVAHLDRHISADEQQAMSQALQAVWEIGAETAVLITQVAVSGTSKELDYYRLARQFFQATTETERIQFLQALFTIAAATGPVSQAASEAIHRLSRSLNLRQSTFIRLKSQFSGL